ncbi:MAG: isoprenylcysteine carboxylmethyltransferase family protein, partial [Bacteroidetes bacterium]|nr:isoprenylcysteine carboxylmethyltransferase family protein [Bacteroidota bacterium]
ISIVFFIISFLIPGLDYRYQWSAVPLWLVILSTLLMVFGYVMFIAAMIQNSYASRVIEIQENQRVIDTGLYSIVRHPMYLAASILYLFSPIVLGSFYGVIPMLLLPFVLAYRIRNEEDVLVNGLEGYKEYMQKVKYRLIPHVW